MVKLGLVDEVVGFKVLDGGWEWIEEEDFVLWLEGLNFKGALLRVADLSGADLSGADLSGADLSDADLNGAVISGTFFRLDKNNTLISIDSDRYEIIRSSPKIIIFLHSRTNLRDVNLRGANLHGANLRGANLHGAKLRGAKLRGVILNRTIFHKEHRESLESMGIDISNLIFVDEDGKKVGNLAEVE